MESRLIVTFYTTAAVMATEKICKDRQIPGRVIPVPRKLSSDCGMAWSTVPEARDALERALREENIEYDGFYTL